MKINSLSLQGGSLKGLKIPKRSIVGDPVRSNALTLNDTGDGKFTVTTTVVPQLFTDYSMRMAIGNRFCLAIRDDGSIVGWGTWSGITNYIPQGNDFVAVAAAGYTAAALRSDGSIVAWGSSSPIKSNVPAGTGYKSLTVGDVHDVAHAIAQDGSIVSWGDDGYGQVSNTPSGNDFKAVSVGTQGLSMALRSDGTTIAWGRTLANSFNAANKPVAKAIDSGHYFMGLLDVDGFVQVYASAGEHVMDNAPADGGYVQFNLGYDHGIALRPDGTATVWGEANKDVMNYKNTIESFSDIKAVQSLARNVMILRANGSIRVYGNDQYGIRDVPSGVSFLPA